ncbi:MAG: hypothetical protein ACRD0P_25350, partial [Stackebrandtia sp.]
MGLFAPLLNRAWPLPVVSMLVIGGLGMWRPGLWADELATWGAIEQPWPDLWALLRNTDAVNGGYYAMIKVWSAVFGTGEFALRVPSLLAMSAAAGLTAATGARLWAPRWGLLAGAVFVVLPTTSRYAAEARGYAFALAFAALASYLLVRLCRGESRRFWVYYALSLMAVGFFHLLALLLLSGHLLLLLLLKRELWWRWLIAAAVSCAALSPLAVLGARQRGQTSWIDPLSLSGLANAPKDLFESRWTALVVAVLIVLVVWRFRDRVTVAVAVLGLAPVVALLLAATVIDIWVPRYLLFAVPVWALLAARAAAGTRHARAVALTLVAILAVSGLGAQYDIRRSSGHTHDTLGAAAVIAERFREGDGFAVALNEEVVPWE